MTPAPTGSCPCGRSGTFGPLPYDRCCGRFLDDPTAPAPDAESLMRSRYTAYGLGRRDYLLATWDAAHRPKRLDLDPGLTWLGLQILDAPAADGERAEVEFVATFTDRVGRAGRLHERSRFVRRGGRWLYVDGSVRG